jgi:hypothetical protein
MLKVHQMQLVLKLLRLLLMHNLHQMQLLLKQRLLQIHLQLLEH